ncbi:hypothetical protein POM88_054052 [Heracleum sosnowskyi]|uniref:Uncharacterized protein n=1 Tax=Heracleum sosnowskyi TaxID=360622 RepID=A0AAD8LX27_9APIA|nr:hypothetical protein POM88_054050 [Heracleum sosnowskyi]KAK1351768.1 hypothetical protein POM88_054051 [Heracleum sosnowskyi]KAK1351769.1 hypothetical protein POM88_054052 [Heracleum sosnowskyi]
MDELSGPCVILIRSELLVRPNINMTFVEVIRYYLMRDMHRAKFLLPEGTLLFTTGGQDGNMVCGKNEELHELGKIFNLINSNSAEGISEYFQSLDSCNSIDGDYDLATKRKEDQQREIDKFVSISLRFSDRGKLISSVRDMEATFGYATVIKKSKLILLNRWVLQVYDKYHKVPLGLKADMHEKISNIVDSSIPVTLEPKAHPHKGRPSNSAKRKK